MAKRPEHQKILEVISWLDADFLTNSACWFAGGTAVSLRCSEFRLSHDVDFLCSSREGYRALREKIYDIGIHALFKRDVTLRREVRADRYGIRFVLDVHGMPLKFEIVSEGRIELEGAHDPSLPVSRLQDQDLVAEKLLANEDRFLDESAMARDMIDLIMLEHVLGELPVSAWKKAKSAYGDSIEKAYHRALRRLRDDSAWTERAYGALSITPEAREILQKKLSDLR